MAATAVALPGRAAACAALLGATVAWGSTFVVTKASLDELAPATFLAWRFGIAAVVLLAVSARRTRSLSAQDLRRAGGLGLLLGAGFLLQTTGLRDTSAGLSGFLTGSSVVMVPVVASVLFGSRVGRSGWLAVGLSMVGLVLLTGGGSPASLTGGAAITLLGAACFAGHITGLSEWATPANAVGCHDSVGRRRGCRLCRRRPRHRPAVGAAVHGRLVGGRLRRARGHLPRPRGARPGRRGRCPAVTAAVVMTMEPVVRGRARGARRAASTDAGRVGRRARRRGVHGRRRGPFEGVL